MLVLLCMGEIWISKLDIIEKHVTKLYVELKKKCSRKGDFLSVISDMANYNWERDKHISVNISGTPRDYNLVNISHASKFYVKYIW